MDDNLYQPPGTEPATSAGSKGGFGRFDMGAAFSGGWEAFSRNMGTAIGSTLVLVLLLIVAVFSCVGWVTLPHLSFGFAFIGLYAMRGRLEMNHAFTPFKRFGPVLGYFLLAFLINLVVSVTFAAPTYYIMFEKLGAEAFAGGNFAELMQKQAQIGFGWWTLVNYVGTAVTMYISVRLFIAVPLLVERNYGVIDAFKESIAVTGKYQWPLMGFYLAITAIMAGGILLCVLPALFTLPLGVVLMGAAMHQLLGESTAV